MKPNFSGVPLLNANKIIDVISKSRDILGILDRCCESFTFPMLDNGYIYLASTRLSLFRSTDDWAMVIEVFGFSPREGLPDVCVYTFASKLHERDTPEKYVDHRAYDNYLVNNPHNEARFFFPIDEGPWQDAENLEVVADGAKEIVLRGRPVQLPSLDSYENYGVHLEAPPKVRVFELCRYLAATHHESVIATPTERRISVLPEMSQILQLDEWHHPNLVAGEKASDSEAFQQLALVLTTGDASLYKPTRQPNTHWKNWPDGGTL